MPISFIARIDCQIYRSTFCFLGSKPLALKVFVAGRNRLENEGAKALAKVFQTLTSLEEVAMPQNGIYHDGITAIAGALSFNPGLRILNLNDNTIGYKGAQAIAKALPNFQNLEQLNLGDCLLKTRGVLILAEALGAEGSYPSLTELNLSYNEIHTRGANPIALAVADKEQLVTLQLGGNAFGEEGRAILRDALTVSKRVESLSILSDQDSDEESTKDSDEDSESEDDYNNDVDYNNEDDDNNEEEEDLESKSESFENGTDNRGTITNGNKTRPEVSIAEFLKSPTGEKLLLLQGGVEDCVNHAKVSK